MGWLYCAVAAYGCVCQYDETVVFIQVVGVRWGVGGQEQRRIIGPGDTTDCFWLYRFSVQLFEPVQDLAMVFFPYGTAIIEC